MNGQKETIVFILVLIEVVLLLPINFRGTSANRGRKAFHRGCRNGWRLASPTQRKILFSPTTTSDSPVSA
ncbi:hypothetical protein L6164_022305 [Bauhinia variegata]|uniref:Uncharacterized protein n=1 Tax=Bauhinia variegata TaxID=167791 RepID=A0ACB9MGM5_BAUVA|nr:hypothetical protein L6164_022305 [Bauhinia variegata]